MSIEKRSRQQKGIALTIVMVVIVMLAIISVFATNLGFNKKKMIDANSGRRAKIYFKAQAGVVDATTRIRKDYTVGLNPAGTFTNDLYDPNPYLLDVDLNGVNDVRVDIGPVIDPLKKNRRIQSLGLDV